MRAQSCNMLGWGATVRKQGGGGSSMRQKAYKRAYKSAKRLKYRCLGVPARSPSRALAKVEGGKVEMPHLEHVHVSPSHLDGVPWLHQVDLA